MYVDGLELEEIEESGVVHGGHGPCRGGLRGIGGEAVCATELIRQGLRGVPGLNA